MRPLGFLLLLVGIGLCVVHLMEVKVEWLEWIDNLGTDVGWYIRGGVAVLGLLLVLAGKKKGGGKKK